MAEEKWPGETDIKVVVKGEFAYLKAGERILVEAKSVNRHAALWKLETIIKEKKIVASEKASAE